MAQQPTLAVSKSNIVWLMIILVVGLVAWQAFGVIGGLIAAAAALVVSEVVERRKRASR